MLTRVKMVLGIKTDEHDTLLNQLIANAEVILLSNVGVEYVITHEPLLQVIVEEMVVERFNRLGAEGMTSQDIEGYSKSFDKASFEKYSDYIELFHKSKGLNKKGFRML